MNRPSNLSVLVSATVVIASYWAASQAARLQLPGVLQYGLIAVAVASTVWFLYVETSALRGLDELQRKIQLEALGIAYPIAIGFLMALGLLQKMVVLPPEDLSYRHVWPFLVLFYFVGLGIAARRYR